MFIHQRHKMCWQKISICKMIWKQLHRACIKFLWSHQKAFTQLHKKMCYGSHLNRLLKSIYIIWNYIVSRIVVSSKPLEMLKRSLQWMFLLTKEKMASWKGCAQISSWTQCDFATKTLTRSFRIHQIERKIGWSAVTKWWLPLPLPINENAWVFTHLPCRRFPSPLTAQLMLSGLTVRVLTDRHTDT